MSRCARARRSRRGCSPDRSARGCAILGSEFTGTVAAVGDGVERVRASATPCGASPAPGMRAHAEYVVVPADGIIEPLPAGLDPIDGGGAHRPDRAVVPRRHGRARRGSDDPHQRRVRSRGHVGGPARRAPRGDRHRRLQRRARAARARARRPRGARLPRRRRRRDAPRRRAARSTWSSTCYGNLGYRRARDLLTPTGRYCGTVPTLPILWHTLLTRRSSGPARGDRLHGTARAGCRAAPTCARRRRSPQAGVLKPVVDAVYPLDRVADAHAHVERGKAGHIVLTME